MKSMFLALVASLSPCAAFAQSVVTSPTLLPGTDPAAPTSLKLVTYASKVTPKVPKNTPVFGPCNATAPFIYSRTGACPTVEPEPDPTPTPTPEPTPAPTPTPTSAVTIAGGEAFLSSSDVVVGINASGNIGSRYTAPGAFRDTGEVYSRKGYYIRATKSDTILPGAPIDYFTIGYTYRGERVTLFQGEMMGKAQIPGAHDPVAGAWIGAAGCIRLTQTPALAGSTLTLAITIRNTCPEPINDVRYLHGQDINDGEADAGMTARKIVAAGALEATLRGASKPRVYRLTTTDPRFTAAIYGVAGSENPDRAEWTSQKVGYAPKYTVMANINLLGRLTTIASGGETAFVLSMGVSR